MSVRMRRTGSGTTQCSRASISLKALSKRVAKRHSRNEPPAPVSRKQQAHFDALLTALDASNLAREVDAELTRNGANYRHLAEKATVDPARKLAYAMRSCTGGDRRVGRCVHPQCVRCRRDQIGRRIAAALPVFEPHPLHAIYWVTVLLSAEPNLYERSLQDNVLDPLSIRLPTKAEIAAKTKRTIVSARKRVDAAVRSLAPVEFIAEGAFEFDAIDPATCGVHKARFLADMGIATGAAADPKVPDVALLHLHFVCTVKRKNGYVTALQLARALKAKFPGRRSVHVKPLHAQQPVLANVRRLVAYSSKAFSDFRTERAVQVALVLGAIGRRGLGFVRRKGQGSTPTSGRAAATQMANGIGRHADGIPTSPTIWRERQG